MNKFKNILICTDLDGTLLGSDRAVSRENLEAIEYFKSRGGYFTFITGRMPLCVTEIFDTVKPNVPFGCVNGGGLYDRKNERYVKTFALDKRALTLVEYVDREFPSVGIQINTFNSIYFSKDSEGMRFFRDVTGMPNLTRDYRDISEPFAKVLFADTDTEEISRLAEVLPRHPAAGDLSFTRSEKFFFEILPKGITKATTLTELCSHIGIPVNRSIALGDYSNDVDMIRAAGVGVAVGNATEDAKSVADLVTVTNDEHAVAKVIRDLDNGKISLPL